MTRGNIPDHDVKWHKNKDLHGVSTTLFHNAVDYFKFMLPRKNRFPAVQVWTSRRWLWTLIRMPTPMNRVSSAEPP
jgi:hypothetical protein